MLWVALQPISEVIRRSFHVVCHRLKSPAFVVLSNQHSSRRTAPRSSAFLCNRLLSPGNKPALRPAEQPLNARFVPGVPQEADHYRGNAQSLMDFSTRDLGQLLFAALGPNSAPALLNDLGTLPVSLRQVPRARESEKKRHFSFVFSSSSPMLKQSFRPLLKEACLRVTLLHRPFFLGT